MNKSIHSCQEHTSRRCIQIKRRQIIYTLLPTLTMLLIIIDSKTALLGAKSGLDMCLKVIIPTLFPFIFLSVLTTSSLSRTKILPLRPLARICGIPEGAEHILIMAILGGYPIGAQAVHRSWKEGIIDKHTAQRLLAFCNNAGPSFVFGLLGTVFSVSLAPLFLWIIHIISALTVGYILPGKRLTRTKSDANRQTTLAEALHISMRTVAEICCWVLLFRVFLTFADRYVLYALSPTLKVLVTGCLELVNGCLELISIQQEKTRFIIASVLLSLGGLCVFFQTTSVTRGLNIKLYFPGKLIQTALSLILSILCIPFLYNEIITPYNPLLLGGTIITFLLISYFKKNCSIPKETDV